MALEKLTRARVGISSVGIVVGTASTINFVGTGNTIIQNHSFDEHIMKFKSLYSKIIRKNNEK